MADYCGTRDLVVTRHFFIHQNYESALWVTKLANRLLKPGGILVADYYFPNEDGAQRIAEGKIRPAHSPWDPDYPSRMFVFEDHEIEQVAAASGFQIDDTERVPEVQRRFVRMIKAGRDTDSV